MLVAMALVAVIVTFVIVTFGGAQLRPLGRFRLGVVLDGIGRTQGFAFQAQGAEQTARMGYKLHVSGLKPPFMAPKLPALAAK